MSLHGQFRADNHVAGPSTALVTLPFEQFSCRMQVEEGLITEVRLGTGVADEQDFCHRIEAEKQVIGFLITLFVPLEQVNLHLSRVDLVLPSTRVLYFLAILFPLLYIFDIHSNLMTQFEERRGHIGGDFVDDEPADVHIDR